jgi:hypothetical protein
LFHIVGVKAHLAGHLPQQQIDVPDDPVHDSRDRLSPVRVAGQQQLPQMILTEGPDPSRTAHLPGRPA